MKLGQLLRKAARFEEARTLYQAALDDPNSHPGDRLAALRGLHGCALSTGDLTAARRFAEEAVRVAEPMGDSAVFRALGSLTDACFAQGDLVGARSAADRALSAARRGSDIQGLFFALHRSANVALAEGNLERARADILEAQPHAEAMDRARGRTLHGDALSELRGRLAEIERARSRE